jgi:hypothetical protein
MLSERAAVLCDNTLYYDNNWDGPPFTSEYVPGRGPITASGLCLIWTHRNGTEKNINWKTSPLGELQAI